jgi:hypothetical protein
MDKEKSQRASEEPGKMKSRSLVLTAFIVFLIFVVVVMVVNSRKPGSLTMENADRKVKGAYFIRVNQALLKPMYENWLPNDLFWPTIFLDNMPNFQIGELEVVRYNVRVLRDNLSRMRTTDRLDPFAEAAFTALSNDPYKWWFPSAEGKWKLSHNNLESYYQGLLTGKSHFLPRADNLIELLGQYVSLMGGVNTRLINAPRDIKEAISEDERKGEPKPPAMVEIDIPWHKIDDNFYYAQGVAYALYESFKAIEIDFQDILKDKNSIPLVKKILELLKRCDFEPLIVFNGDPDSIFANHSLNLSGVFNDARQKMNSLIVALMQG